MSIIYDFGNNQSWVSIFNDTFTAAAVPTQELREYYPIPDIVIPIQISSPVIAIYCASSSDPGTWNYAGKVRQKINSGLLVGGVLDGLIATRRLKLREVNILRFDRVSSSYSIEISIPYWLRDIGLLVWEYIGLIECNGCIKSQHWY
jgi:hypothetical protein